MSSSMRLLNIVYTNEMEASVAFYERLGFSRKEAGEINQWWNEFPIGDASVALHWNNDQPLPTQSNPELHLQVSAEDFDGIYANIEDLKPSDIGTLQGMARIFTVTDPNGVRIQFNEEA